MSLLLLQYVEESISSPSSLISSDLSSGASSKSSIEESPAVTGLRELVSEMYTLVKRISSAITRFVCKVASANEECPYLCRDAATRVSVRSWHRNHVWDEHRILIVTELAVVVCRG